MVVDRPVLDLGFREQVVLWPMVILMLVMGVVSPYWMKAINGAVTGLADSGTHTVTYLEKR
jgi:NADH-quinone oxidoreductase subunit M